MNFFVNIFNSFGNFLLTVLPTSPFQKFFSDVSIPYLNYVNWFVPFDRFVVILSSWIGCIILYYAWVVVGRWIKVLGN